MGQEIVNWKIVFKNDKRTKSIKQFWDFHDVGRTAEEKSRAEAPQQQYARSTTTNLLEKFLDEKKKSREDNSEDGVHVDNGEFPNSRTLETMTDAENPFFVSGHDSDDATDNQDELVPLKNTRKRLFSEISNGLPLSHIMSVMEKYRAKSTTSKYDLAQNFILDLTPGSRIEKEFEPVVQLDPCICFHKNFPMCCRNRKGNFFTGISVKHTCYVPQMVKLESLNDYSSLKVNKWNIPEPDHDQNRDIGLAFELNRNRLDHGKGYYDKYLTKYRQWTKPPIANSLNKKIDENF
ncbi:hypothetical protein C2G38_2143305 [Gigaspora rosea]|uniref:5-formyltetrahydrofolate cyclo-ligase n=1 Tax=Gigaspora rosea TaxID=44941 RepID=A0A397V0K2_9GLOM|nr:hypothetical protein C2G38_2143305 [Gigaspora rosea]